MFKFEKLNVWCKTIDYFDNVDSLLVKIDKRYRFSLVDQMLRATLSVSNNIAEASGRNSKKEQNYFFNVAKGSVYETVSMLFVMKRRELIIDKEFEKLYNEADEIARMISGLMK